MIELELQKRYDDFVLDVVLRSEARILGVVGPSGSGKSTMLHCIAGLTGPERGRVALDGQAIVDCHSRRPHTRPQARRVGYVVQDGLLFPHLTVRRNLEYGLNAHGRAPEWAEVVHVLSLDPLLDRMPGTLSVGEGRRVALGRAILSGPQLLLLDEPTAGLDPRSAGRALQFLKDTLTHFEMSAIFVSHSLSEVMFLCDDSCYLREGRVVAQGHPSTLASLAMGDADCRVDLRNLFAATRSHVDKGGLAVYTVGAQRLRVAVGEDHGDEKVLLSLPASDILLARTKPERISARNILECRVVHLSDLGDRVLVSIDVGVEWIVLVTKDAVAELELSEGVALYAIVKASAVSAISRDSGRTPDHESCGVGIG